jgi:hypothetical protein
VSGGGGACPLAILPKIFGRQVATLPLQQRLSRVWMQLRVPPAVMLVSLAQSARTMHTVRPLVNVQGRHQVRVRTPDNGAGNVQMEHLWGRITVVKGIARWLARKSPGEGLAIAFGRAGRQRHIKEKWVDAVACLRLVACTSLASRTYAVGRPPRPMRHSVNIPAVATGTQLESAALSDSVGLNTSGHV